MESISKQIIDRGELLTESVHPNSTNLDQLETLELVRLFSEEDLMPQKAVSNAIPELVKAIDLIVSRIKEGGRLFYIGTGTSGRLGVLDASECPPTFCTPFELVQGIIAGGINSMVKSSEGLEDDKELSIKDLRIRSFSKKDSLIGITAGGTTPYVLSALNYSLNLGALTIAMSCVPKKQSFIPSDIDIRLLTGPELLTGSTRLKAGTATKMALNIISTSVMVKLGKVYGNMMVDLSCTNKKLVDRSIRILSDITSIDRKSATELIDKCDGSLKLAILTSLSGLPVKKSKKLLEKNNNSIKEALLKL